MRKPTSDELWTAVGLLAVLAGFVWAIYALPGALEDMLRAGGAAWRGDP